jgi:hypothetical protein
MALFVAKGNPKGVKPQLDEIFRKDLNLILGNANSGSVGQKPSKCSTRPVSIRVPSPRRR